MKYTTEEKIFITNKYAISRSPAIVQRAWRTKFISSFAPSHATILRIAKQFEKTGSIINSTQRKRNISQKRTNAKTILKEVISEKPSLSIRKACQVAEISYNLSRLILKDDLKLKPYKVPDAFKLEPVDYPKRVDFCNWIKSLPKKVLEYFLFSDEAYFSLTQAVNKQNNRLWLNSRPTDAIEHPLHDLKVLCFCAMSSQRIYGPYFFEGTVNQHNYLNMLKEFLWPKVVREDYKKYYFQQDGAKPHVANIVQNYLKSKFGDKFLDKKRWPPRSPDLNPCDFFLWGYLKSKVYNPLPKNLDELKANIQREIKNIDKATRESVCKLFEIANFF